MAEPITLRVDGQLYSGWQKVRITRSLRDIAGDFELHLTRKWKDAKAMAIREGSACTVHIGNDLVLTGYVDDFTPSYDAKEVSWVVSGRSKTSDLVDCSAIYKTGQWQGVTLDKVARDISKPFGIQVVIECDLGAAFPRVAIEQGETCFELLDRMAKQRAILLTTNEKGQLVLTQASKQEMGVSLILGVNILAARGNFSMRDRASEWIVKGSSYGGGATWDATATTTIGGQKATIADPDVPRYRPRIIIAEDVTTVAGASKRGQWQKQRSIGEGTQTEITVAGWRTQGVKGDKGPLWRINRICPIKCEFQGLDVSWLIVSVTMMEDDKAGREAIINLMPREAMLIPVEVAKKQTKEVTTWQ
ncbi:phage baseplate assembly protein [Aeromonas salmonicida]|uniref:phage baseplate assembly protein n=1 Tax=Aeromonas salmonicida TaxID=645 RepID=UPI0022400672|nr:contractile injection system protein, VgrG/Pvc8 family [Aeromonas salmonicida]